MKKILILANSSIGLYKFRLELIQELLKLNFIVYFSLPDNVDDIYVKKLEGIGAIYIQTKFIRNKVNIFSDLLLFFKYILLIKKIKPNVILTYTIKPNIYGSFAAKFYNTPTIINITGLGNSFNNKLLSKVVIYLYKYACNNAKFVFFQNNFNKDFFINNNIVKKAIIKQIPGSGVNLNRYKFIEKEKRKDTVNFVFIGRIMKEKGIEEYLQVAQKITSIYQNTTFYILGEFNNPKYSLVINSIRNERIRYVGFIDNIYNFMKDKNIDCIIHPSYYYEGMSNVLLEAAAMGIPIIASNIPGCKEVVEDKKNGFLIAPKDIDDLYKKVEIFVNLDISIKNEMGIYGRKIVEKYFDRSLVINVYLDCVCNL